MSARWYVLTVAVVLFGIMAAIVSMADATDRAVLECIQSADGNEEIARLCEEVGTP